MADSPRSRSPTASWRDAVAWLREYVRDNPAESYSDHSIIGVANMIEEHFGGDDNPGWRAGSDAQ